MLADSYESYEPRADSQITWHVLTAQVAAKDLSNSELVNPKPVF